MLKPDNRFDNLRGGKLGETTENCKTLKKKGKKNRKTKRKTEHITDQEF